MSRRVPGPGHRHRANVGASLVEPRVAQRPLDDRGDRVDLGTAGELGDHAAEARVQCDRRLDDARQDVESGVTTAAAVSSQLVSMPKTGPVGIVEGYAPSIAASVAW